MKRYNNSHRKYHTTPIS